MKIDYKYFQNESENPFTDEEDIKLNKHMWWHYEQHYSFNKDLQISYPSIDNFIKYILENKLDYGDIDGTKFRQYCDNKVVN